MAICLIISSVQFSMVIISVNPDCIDITMHNTAVFFALRSTNRRLYSSNNQLINNEIHFGIPFYPLRTQQQQKNPLPVHNFRNNNYSPTLEQIWYWWDILLCRKWAHCKDFDFVRNKLRSLPKTVSKFLMERSGYHFWDNLCQICLNYDMRFVLLIHHTVFFNFNLWLKQ